MMDNFLNQLLHPSMGEGASGELRLRRKGFSAFKATSVNEEDFSSQNDCEGQFATILKEMMHEENSDFRPWIVSDLIPIPFSEVEYVDVGLSTNHNHEDGFTLVNSSSQEKFPLSPLGRALFLADLSLSFRLSSPERTYRNQAKGQENQLYQQQILLMPLLQFPMPEDVGLSTNHNHMANDQNIIQSEAETLATVESSVLIDANVARNFIPENQLVPFVVEPGEIFQTGEANNTNLVLENFRQQVEYIMPELRKVVSQDVYDSAKSNGRLRLTAKSNARPRGLSGISPWEESTHFRPLEELNDVSLALCLRKTEKSLVVSLAGIDSEKTRQLFFSAAPMLHNQLKQIFTYKSLGKIESRLPQSKPLSKRTEPNSGGVNANLNSLGNDRLSFLIRARAFPPSIGGQGGEGFPPAQQAKQNASIIQNERPGLLSDVSPADIINQIGHKMQITFREPLDLKTGLEELRVQLKPEHLGSVTLKASMTEGLLAVDINTASVAARNIIESHLHDLRQNLSQQGIEVGQFNVSAEANMSGFGSQWEMFSPREQDVSDDKHNTQLLVDETWQQESWLARQTLVDLWM